MTSTQDHPEHLCCEAHGDHPGDVVLQNEEATRPYRVCKSAAERLVSRTLPFEEWFHLARLHGGNLDLLREYVYNNAEHAAAWFASHVRVDTLTPTAVDRFLDFLTAWDVSDPDRWWNSVAAGESQLDADNVLEVLQRRVEGPASGAERTAVYLVFALLVGPRGEGWIKQRWRLTADKADRYLTRALVSAVGSSEASTPVLHAVRHADAGLRLNFLASVQELTSSESFDVALPWVDKYLQLLPATEREWAAYSLLSGFRDRRCLALIQSHAEQSGYAGHWHSLLAASRPTWDDLGRWMGAGGVLMRIALTTARICTNLDRSRAGGLLEGMDIDLRPVPMAFIHVLRHCRKERPLIITERIMREFEGLANGSCERSM